MRSLYLLSQYSVLPPLTHFNSLSITCVQKACRIYFSLQQITHSLQIISDTKSAPRYNQYRRRCKRCIGVMQMNIREHTGEQVSNNYLTHDTIASGKYFHVHRAAVFHGSKVMRTDQGVHHSLNPIALIRPYKCKFLYTLE